MTDLQSAILAALRIRHPEAMTDVQIWAATGGYEYGGHSLSCAIGCFELLRQGAIELVEDGKKWKLTDTEGAQTEDSQSSQGNVGQMMGADRKPLSSNQDAPLREVAESSQSGHGFAPPPANSGETGSCGIKMHTHHPSDAMCTAPAGLSDFDCGGGETEITPGPFPGDSEFDNPGWPCFFSSIRQRGWPLTQSMNGRKDNGYTRSFDAGSAGA